jgi:PAS domain S-box-containing protein
MTNIIEKIRHQLFRRTVTSDLTNGLALFLTLILILGAALNYFRTVHQLEDNLNVLARDTSEKLAEVLSSPVWTLDKPTIQNIGKAFQQTENVRTICIYDDTQQILFGTPSSDINLIIAAAPIYYNNFKVGSVEVAVSKDRIWNAQKEIFGTTILTILLVVLTIQIGTTILIQRFLSRPLKALISGLDTIANGQDYHGLPALPQADVNEIIQRVNLMASQISERVEALRRSEERFRQVVTSISDLIYLIEICPDDIIIRYISPHVETLTGYQAEFILENQTFWGTNLIFPQDMPILIQQLNHLQAGENFESEYRLVRRDKTIIWVRDSARFEQVGNTRMSYGVISDITERKKVEESLRAETRERKLVEQELRRYQEHLEELVSGRTAELQMINRELASFGYSISHDLRAPLRHIDGYSSLIIEDYGSQIPPEAHQYLQRIRTSIHRMSDLIDGLLRLSRVNQQPLNIQPIEPTAVVQTVLEEMTSERLGRQIEIQIGSLPTCQADPILLAQVYTNLINNAIKYTRVRENAVIEISSLQQDHQTVYFVRDNGIGYDMRYAEKLFGIFQRLHSDKDFDGTGIGLALVQRIVHRHGGQIWASGVVDQGATFYFTLAGSPLTEQNQDHFNLSSK